MPARDPAASPHLPSTTPGGQSGFTSFTLGSGPILPTHGGRRVSAASNSRSELSPSGRRESRRVSDAHTQQGIVGKFFRRLSVTTPTSEVDRDVLGEADDEASDGTYDEEDSILGTSAAHRAIRESTNRLASMSFTSRSLAGPGVSGISLDHRRPSPLNPLSMPAGSQSHSHSDALSTSVPPSHSYGGGPSGLSMLMERGRRQAASSDEDSGETTPNAKTTVLADEPSYSTPQQAHTHPGRSHITIEPSLAGVPEEEDVGSTSDFRQYLEREAVPASERTPLLGGPLNDKRNSWRARTAIDLNAARNRIAKVTPADLFRMFVKDPIECLPAVLLGLLLNVLDGVSYGMILFPQSDAFPDFGSIGVSMFFMSCIFAQLVYSLGGSIFPGGNGSMMIECVPFFHLLTTYFSNKLAGNNEAIVATTMVAFALSSIFTGLVFFILGWFRLGTLIGYFPRHILVGCIGGVGVFLFVTGLQVSIGLSEAEFEYNLPTLKLYFSNWHTFALWTIPLGLAILLRVITHFFHHQLIFPGYFLLIPIIFYATVFIGGWDFATLRANGWVFEVGTSKDPWWKFYTYFHWNAVSWSALWETIPTQAALVFFGILHVPLNIPALGVSLAEDNVKLDRELVAHGFSNFGAGLLGTVPNYLTYVNSVLFYRVGGGTRLSGVLLAAATAGIMMMGPTVIGLLPVMVVGALIYVLGIDLIVESVWDTRHRVNRMEYITIWVIMFGMTVFDFVIGLLMGVILACVFFVVQSSRRRPIRAVFTGATAKSTVRRPRAQRAFIQSVGSQTMVMKLQGFLFFGTITHVEDEIRKLLDIATWENHPIRFLIIDFYLVAGVDFSSAEAFVRIQRLLAAKDVLLILTGADPHSHVGTALRAVDLWADQEGTRVEVFSSLNDALEWTENTYLTAFYENQNLRVKDDEQKPRTIDLPKINRMPFNLAESFQNSPRRSHLARAGDDNLNFNFGPQVFEEASEPREAADDYAQPLPILLQTMGAYCDEDDNFFRQLCPYFKQVVMQQGGILWRQGEASDGLYLIEAGSLRATYAYDEHTELVQETMVAGTVAGDLSTLSDTLRNATVVAERDCVLWKLEPEALARLEKEKPEVARRFVKLVLKTAVEEVDSLASHLIAVLS